MKKLKNNIFTSKDITIILTLFNPSKKDLIKWKQNYISLKSKGINFNIIIDNPNLNINSFFDENDIYKNKINIGKFESIYFHIKNNYVKTKFIKVFDPDDDIDIENFMEFKFNDYGINKINNARVNGDNVEIVKQKSLGNSWTILPMLEIKKDELYIESPFKVRNWLEDQFLGIVAYVNGANIFYNDYSWYLYDVTSGMTNFLEEKDILEIIDTLKTIYFYLEKIEKRKMRKLVFPGKLFYIKDLIIKSNIDNNKKENFIKEINLLIKNNK